MNKSCNKCGADNIEQARFCSKCGTGLDLPKSPAAIIEPSLREERGLNTTKLAKDRIIDQWSTMIPGAQGRGGELAKSIERILAAVEAPNLKLERKGVHLGIVDMLFGGMREFLVVDNEYLKGYRIFIGARDYGKQLNVSWYLTLEQSFWRRLVRGHAYLAILFFAFLIVSSIYGRMTGRGGVAPEMMNLFDREELSSYATTVYQATKQATEELMKDMELNSSKVNWQTRGFLNIS